MIDKMKLRFSWLALVLTLLGCSSSGQQIDLQVPDKVAVTKSRQHMNIPETQLFFVKPAQFNYDKVDSHFEKDKSNFIAVLKYPNRDIDGQIEGFKESIKELVKKGAVAYYKKDLLINANKALLVYSPSDKAGLEQISLITGNSQNSYLVKGYFPLQNESLRGEMLKTLLSIIVDNSVRPKILQRYTLDSAKYPFKVNDVDGDTEYYTINGKGNLKMNYVQNQIILQTLPAMPSFETRKQYNDSMLDRFRNSQKISNLVEKEVMINGLKGFESSYIATEKKSSISSHNYQLVVGNENVTIFLTGLAYTNKEVSFAQIKEFIRTLKLN